MMTNFLCCLYLNKPCLPKESDCPAAGGGVGLSGGRGGKGVPWILETGPGPPTDQVQIMYRLCTVYNKYAHTFLRIENFILWELNALSDLNWKL